MVKIFETRVTAIGAEANQMMNDANMLILFGEGAPADLAEFCYTIDNKNLQGKIEEGNIISIDHNNYRVTFVGDLVEKNLSNLGHITISFDGSTEGSLPGTLHVKGPRLPMISQESLITICR